MPQLESYFREGAGTPYEPPMIRSLTESEARPDFLDAKVEVVRPRMPLGYKPAKLSLHIYAKNGVEMDPPDPEDWDDKLNTALIERGIRAISPVNEQVRMSLGLRAALREPETRFGDGYYNGVLIDYIQSSTLEDHPEIERVLPHIRRVGFGQSSRSHQECSRMIDWAIRDRARELTNELRYAIPEAEAILGAAVAQYLDDRFSVTNRRNLGML